MIPGLLIKFSINIKKINFLQLGETIDPFKITAVLHSSGTFVRGKMPISWKNRDFLSTLNCSMASFYGKGYYYLSQMYQMNAGPQLS
jgi:hypothetical protein